MNGYNNVTQDFFFLDKNAIILIVTLRIHMMTIYDDYLYTIYDRS